MGRKLIAKLSVPIVVSIILWLFSCDNIEFLETLEQSQRDLFTGISPGNEELLEETTPQITWPQVSDAAGYELQIAMLEENVSASDIITLETNKYVFSSELDKGDRIYWRVRAIDSASRYSAWSDIFWFFIPHYFIGEEGPAGGLIFHNAIDGFYLEAAPASTEWGNKVWGGQGYLVGATEEEIETGKTNTALIVDQFGSNEPYENKSDYAAKLCDDLVVNGYDDWYLPAKIELEDMLNTLYLRDPPLGDFNEGCYWSSTEVGADYADGLGPGTSPTTQGAVIIYYSGHSKNIGTDTYVRAIRSFEE